MAAAICSRCAATDGLLRSADLSAGVTLGVVMIPVGLAFGELAGLPMAGLYASILPLVAYAMFGSSPHLVVGPDAAMAVLVAASIAPLAAGADEARYSQLAGALSLLIGLGCALGAMCRVGFVANFLAKPVVAGYIHGVAVIILLGQLPKALGVAIGAEEPWNQVIELVRRLGEANPIAFAIAAASVGVILLCRRLAPRVPGQIVVLVAAPLAVVLLGLERYGVAVLGHVPSGLPSLQVPLAGFDDRRALLPVAFRAHSSRSPTRW